MRSPFARLARPSHRRLAATVATAVMAGASLAAVAPAASACTVGCPISPFSDLNTAGGIQVSGTYQPIVGNFGGDNKDDIFWYAPGSAPDTLWYGNSAHGAFTHQSKSISGTYIPIVGNFAGDSYDDILWYSPGTGADTLWTSIDDTNAVFSSTPITINGTFTPAVLHNTVAPTALKTLQRTRGRGNHIMASVYDTIMWSAASPASDSYWTWSGSGHTSHAITIAGSPKLVPFQSDTDGRGDLLAYSPGSGTDAIYRSTAAGGYTRSIVTVNGTYTPVVAGPPLGDQSILWFGPGSATDALWKNDGIGHLVPHSTASISVSGPVVSNSEWTYLYDGAGLDQVYDATDGTVHADNMDDIGSGAHLLVGDFDGNGAKDIFFYRPGAGLESLGYGYLPVA